MIITVIAMRMVKVAVDEIVDVVTVWNGLVTATRSMNVTGIMSAAAMRRRAAIGILIAHRDHVLVDMITMQVMEVPIVEIVDMVAVTDRGMAASGTVSMIMVRVVGKTATGHWNTPTGQCCSQACSTAFLTRLSTWASASA